MSKNKSGNFIAGGNPQVPSLTSNNGVFDTKDVYTAVNNGAWQEADGIYEIPKSLRFRRAVAPYLYRTPAVTSNQKKFTFSFWVKNNFTYANGRVYTGRTGTNFPAFGITLPNGSDPKITIDQYTTGAAIQLQLITTPVFRDPSAWYHIVAAFDTTQAIATDRVKLYINGVAVTSFSTSTYPSQNLDLNVNTTNTQIIGGDPANGGYFDGYLAEWNFIDGQQLDESYFGYFDPLTNIWQPKPYTGPYGTNGCYLPFSENQSLTNLGRNKAGSNLASHSYSPNTSYNSTQSTTTATGAYGETTTVGTYIANNAISSGDTSIWTGRFTPTSGVTYTVSMFVKPLQFPWTFYMSDYGDSSAFTVASSGAAMTRNTSNRGNAGSTILDDGCVQLTNGWYKIWMTYTAGSSNYFQIYSVNHPTGNGSTVGYQFYGFQANLGYGMDPLIITSGTAANNNWTTNNISLTAGSTYDSYVDSPTNVMTTATDVGGVVSGNYCTWNPLFNNGTAFTYRDANTTVAYVATAWGAALGTIAVNSGKWYWEDFATSSTWQMHGVERADRAISSQNHIAGTSGNKGISLVYSDTNGRSDITYNGTNSAYTGSGTNFASGDVIGIALDLDNNNIKFYKNNTLIYNLSNLLEPGAYYTPGCSLYNSGSISTNFGQRPFNYTPPTGYKSLNTTNVQALGSATVGKAGLQPNKWFDSVLYAGMGGTQTVTTPSNMKPDLAWFKMINAAGDNYVWDTSRGDGSFSDIITNSTAAEGYNNAYHNFSFNSTSPVGGFNVTQISPGNEVNYAGNRYVSWLWKQSPTSGFNIVPYTGNGTNMTISHNLGVAPKFIVIKERTSVSNWVIQHDSLGWTQGFLGFNTTNATTTSNYSNNTAPTSSNFTVSTYSFGDTNNNRNYIAYLWAEVPGFSKFGYYVGDGTTNGPFVYTGFKPRYIMIKNATYNGEQWAMIDTARYTNNDSTAHILFANANSVEDLNPSYHQIDILSNGFKVRGASQQLINYAGHTFIYAAFADNAFTLNNRAR